VGIERLQDVIVCPQTEPLDNVRRLLGSGADEDCRDARSRFALPELPDDLEAINTGHHHIHQDQFRPQFRRSLQGRHSVPHSLHLESVVLKQAPEQDNHFLFIVGDQDQAFCLSHA